MHTRFWWVNMKERDHFEDLYLDGRIILKQILKKQCGKVWAGFIWLRIGTGGKVF